MKTYLIYLLLPVILFISCNKDDSQTNDPKKEIVFLENTKIIFASIEDAKTLMGTSDEYTQRLSPFEIKAKTHTTLSEDESDYLRHAAFQAKGWTTTEFDEMKTTILSAESEINALGLNLDLPAEIIIVKSSMEEEGGALGYTRSNFIVLKSVVNEYVFLHELFHIYSRANPEKRDELYKTINFEKCNRIDLPPAIKDMEITNPDAPLYEHFLTVEINGEQKDVVFIIYSETPYSGGSFFNYMQQKLMLVEGDNNNKSPVLVNDQPILKDFSEASNLDELVGTNTDYNLHPEEILADHFAFLIIGQNVPDKSFLDAMEQILK